MSFNNEMPRKITVFPLAVLQVAASVILALSTRLGMLHVGVFFVSVACAMFALQIMISRSYWYYVAASVSVCAAYLIGGLFPCVMSAFCVPIGALTAYMIKKKSTKMSLVAALDIVYIVLFSGLFLSVYLLAGYEFSVAAITGHFSDVVDTVRDAFMANISDEIKEVVVKSMRLKEEDFVLLMETAFETLKLILPAIIISAIGIVAYLTAHVFKLGTMLSGCELLLPDPRWETLPSKVCATVYCLAYVAYSLTMMFSSEVGVFFVVCYSIVIIFTPVMMLMGIKWVLTLRNKGFVIALFIFGAFIMADFAAMLLGFFGIKEVFARHDKIKKQEEQSKRN